MRMTQRTNRVLAIGILLLLPVLADGAPLLRVPWEGLNVVIGHTVSITMPGGTVVTGKAAGIESGALVLNVAKTTDRKAYPKGPLRVPRATLHRLEMLKKGWTYRAVLTPLGAIVGLISGVGATFGSKGSGKEAAGLAGLWAAGIAGGYLLGNSADRHWTSVEILP